jgi:hypothetical protein
MKRYLIVSGAAVLAASTSPFVQNYDDLYADGVRYPRGIGFQEVEVDLADDVDPVGGTYADGQVAPPVLEAPAAEVPMEVSRRRGLQALFILYRLKEADIEAAIVQHVTEPDQQYLALTEFRTSQTFELNRPLVVFMCDAMQLDRAALFIKAAQLP